MELKILKHCYNCLIYFIRMGLSEGLSIFIMYVKSVINNSVQKRYSYETLVSRDHFMLIFK